MAEGKVLWFMDAKGIGFLALEGCPDIPVHYSAIHGEGYRTLTAGQTVTFDVEVGHDGHDQASNVRLSVVEV